MSETTDPDDFYLDIKTLDFMSLQESEVERILSENTPVVFRNCMLGPCIDIWKIDYLNEKLKDETIVIHESDHVDLDFLGKNFRYATCKFHEFIDKLHDSSKHVYFRSANSNPRAKKPARIEDDLPILKHDLSPAKVIPYGNSNLYYSSILRIASSRVQIWTHFDLYDNVLCQVVGKKRVILLSPEDTKYLYVEGDKSPVNNFDDYHECIKSFPLIKQAHLYKAYLEPKDTLFIPALWWHNIRTVSQPGDDFSYSIGFNIFWRDPNIANSSIYAEGDVYGNKKLIPYDAALANLDRALQHLDKLPGKYKRFHQLMLIEHLKTKLSLR